MQVHIGAAVLAVPLAVDHFRCRTFRFRCRTFRVRAAGMDRRAFLRAGLVGTAAGAVFWWVKWVTSIGRPTSGGGCSRRSR